MKAEEEMEKNTKADADMEKDRKTEIEMKTCRKAEADTQRDGKVEAAMEKDFAVSGCSAFVRVNVVRTASSLDVVSTKEPSAEQTLLLIGAPTTSLLQDLTRPLTLPDGPLISEKLYMACSFFR